MKPYYKYMLAGFITLVALLALTFCSSDGEKMLEYKESLLTEFNAALQSDAGGLRTEFCEVTKNIHGTTNFQLEIKSAKAIQVDVYTHDGTLKQGRNHRNISRIVYTIRMEWDALWTSTQYTDLTLSQSFKPGTHEPCARTLGFVQSTVATDAQVIEACIKTFEIGWKTATILLTIFAG